MLSKARIVPLVAALLVIVWSAGTPAGAQPDATYNVRTTWTLGKIDAKDDRIPLKSFSLVVTSGGPSASMLTGSRVPIPTTTMHVTEAQVTPVTSYTYQNIGFSADVEAIIMPNGWIQIRANVENSWVDPDAESGQPVIETRHQRIAVVLQDGDILELARMTDDDGDRYVEVKAEILD